MAIRPSRNRRATVMGPSTAMLWAAALTRVPDERPPDCVPARKHLKDAARHHGLQRLPDEAHGERGVRGRLDEHGAPGEEGRVQLGKRGAEGEVPAMRPHRQGANGIEGARMNDDAGTTADECSSPGDDGCCNSEGPPMHLDPAPAVLPQHL